MAKAATKSAETDIANEKDVELKMYELMFILQPDLRESEVKKKLADFEGALEKAGVNIVEKDLWGKRKLAYRIGKYNEGVYMVYNLEMDTFYNKELNETLRLDKDVIRFLLMTLPKDYKYTKFDLDAKPEKAEPEIEARAPKAAVKPKKEEIKREDEDKAGQAPDKEEVDKKLDEIIEGEDLNL